MENDPIEKKTKLRKADAIRRCIPRGRLKPLAFHRLQSRLNNKKKLLGDNGKVIFNEISRCDEIDCFLIMIRLSDGYRGIKIHQTTH